MCVFEKLVWQWQKCRYLKCLSLVRALWPVHCEVQKEQDSESAWQGFQAANLFLKCDVGIVENLVFFFIKVDLQVRCLAVGAVKLPYVEWRIYQQFQESKRR